MDSLSPGSVDWRAVRKPPFKPLLRRVHSIENCNQVWSVPKPTSSLPPCRSQWYSQVCLHFMKYMLNVVSSPPASKRESQRLGFCHAAAHSCCPCTLMFQPLQSEPLMADHPCNGPCVCRVNASLLACIKLCLLFMRPYESTPLHVRSRSYTGCNCSMLLSASLQRGPQQAHDLCHERTTLPNAHAADDSRCVLARAQAVAAVRSLLGVPLVNIGGSDIADSQRKLVLAVLWLLMRFHIRSLLSGVSSRGHAISDAQLDAEVLHWANAKASLLLESNRNCALAWPACAPLELDSLFCRWAS